MILLELFAIIFVLWLLDEYDTIKVHKRMAKMTNRGELISKDYTFFKKAWQDAEYDWEHERTMFPKEYWAYFERNQEAKNSYIGGIVGKQEMKAGHKPVLSSTYYDKSKFDPFRTFISQYADKINEYNATGRLRY